MFKVIKTADGSPTVIDDTHESSYHSMHGSVQESQHVFIKNGLTLFLDRPELHILEVGFGTGLNALLTYVYAEYYNITVKYTAFELYPIEAGVIEQIDYSAHVPSINYTTVYHALHDKADRITHLDDRFKLVRHKADFHEIAENSNVDLIYLDAFGPGTQPAFWKRPFLDRLERALKPGGVLITYCAQGQFKRELKSLGLEVEALPGPPGKREITRATKP